MKKVMLFVTAIVATTLTLGAFNASNNSTVRSDNTISMISSGPANATPLVDPVRTCSPTGTVIAPTWHNSPNKLFSPCPEVNVGIGTSTPAYKLDVLGTGSFSSNLGVGTLPHDFVQLNVETHRQVGFCLNYNSTHTHGYAVKARVDHPTTKAFAVYNKVDQQDVFRVMGDGTLWSTKIHIDNPGDFPDYVFASDYDLLPMKDLEKFIEAKNHLPGIPSAKEVEQNGINVGDLQLKQMEKIEELTLYILQLNDRLNKLEKENTELKKSSSQLK